MKFVLATDSFKESMTSIEACSIMEKAIKKIKKDAEVIKVPMADGGEGTVEALVNSTGGTFVETEVLNPLGKKIKSSYGILGNKKTAVIEMAKASGIELINREDRNPLITTTYGTGQLIRHALANGIKQIKLKLIIKIVCISTDNGMEVWRSNSEIPKLNDWTLVGDKGFGDSLNRNAMAVTVYDEYLYISATKKFPLVLLIPIGADLIRIDKNDNWEVIVGGEPIIPSKPETGERNKSKSGYLSGFSNPFNVYIWQLKEYSNCLLATTFDHGTNMETLRNIVLLNKDLIVEKVGENLYDLILKLYELILYLFEKFNYKKGFDFYVSFDGIHFESLNLSGLGNPNNYGGRMLMVDGSELYLGTANPFDGCEVLKTNERLFDHMLRYESKYRSAIDIDNYMDEIEVIYNEIITQLNTLGIIDIPLKK